MRHLNNQQILAVEHQLGPLLIVAGAGTGKTTVITERVKYLTEKLHVPLDEILCLTFTEKAAAEMESRIDESLPYGYTQMWVNTFHSFCDRILRDEALNIGFDPDFKLMTESDAVGLINRYLFDFQLNYYRPLGNPRKFISAMLQHINRLKDEDVDVSAYGKWIDQLPDSLEKTRWQELKDFYLDYENLKIKHSLLDFADLITITLKLFRTRPQILHTYQSKFKYILVDEFQDTNYAQNQILNFLSGKDHNLTVVADDDQAIYRWRGAAVSNVLSFRTLYPNAQIVVLNQNYRSTQEILDRSYQFIQHNNPDRLEIKENINKKLISVNPKPGKPIELIHASNSGSEADLVAQKIQQLCGIEKQYEYKDIAILARANSYVEPFLKALDHLSIPHQFLGPSKLLEKSEVKDLIAYLKVLHNFTDNTALYRVLTMPIFGISGRDLNAFTSYSQKANISLFESAEALTGKISPPQLISPPLISEITKSSLSKFIDMVHRHLNTTTSLSIGQITFDFLKTSGLLKFIIEPQAQHDVDKSSNIIKFFQKTKTYEDLHPNTNLTSFIEWLDLALEIGDSPQAGDSEWTETNAVNLLTVHSSKGLEFPIVFIVNAVSNRFPSIERKETIPIPDSLVKELLTEGNFHLQEERRLFYVAMTRAKDELYISIADYYGEGKRTKKLSQFIPEALGETIPPTSTTPPDQLELLDFAIVPEQPIPKQLSNTKIDYLSYSQIQSFLDCPLHYKAKYLLHIPTPPTAASSFGNTIHKTLKEFYSEIISTRPRRAIMFKKIITAIYERNWTSEGYKDPKHSSLYKQKGMSFLTNFLESQFNPNQIPVKLEEPFTVPIFAPQSPLQTIRIGGKMDRVDILPDGSIEIIDYKTSSAAMDQKAADLDLQLSFYALAATTLHTPPFNRHPGEILLSLYYFDQDKKVTTTRSFEQLQAAKHKIFSYVQNISSSSFKCSGSPLCRICDFKNLCDFSGHPD